MLFLGTLLIVLHGYLESAQAVNYEGTLFDSSGAVIAESGVKLKFVIKNQADSCTLYEAEKTFDLSSSSGHFSLDLAAESDVSGTGNIFSDVMSNKSQSLNCKEGGSYSYTGTFEARRIQVVVSEIDGVDISDITLPAQSVDSAAFAVEAETARALSSSLSGDVTGSYSATTIERIRGVGVSATPPTIGQVLTFDGTDYSPSDVSATSVNWAAITGIPAEFSDGTDADTLGGLSCANGEVAKVVTGSWSCQAIAENDPGLQSLTSTEVDQLETIDSSTISTLQWSYLGGMGGQPLESAADFSADEISGDKIDGGTISGFASTGIDDNASATALTIGSSGNVGIGATAPQRPLHLQTGSGHAVLLLNNTASGVSATDGLDIFVEQSNAHAMIRNLEATPLLFGTDSTERMRIDEAGNVGVGTASPTVPLQVHGKVLTSNSGDIYSGGALGSGVGLSLSEPGILELRSANGTPPYIQFTEDSDGFKGQIGFPSGVNDLVFQTGGSTFSIGTERMRITASGDIGIGTSSPGEKLEVSGNIKGTQLCIGADCRSTWPSGGGGTVSQVDTGNGLTGGPITGTGTLAIDLDSNPGLEFNSGKLRAKIGAGLTRDASGLNVDAGVASGQILEVDDLIACTSTQKLQWTVATGWSCVADIDTDTTYSNATPSVAGLMSTADKSKLDGVAAGAQPDMTEAEIISTLTNDSISGNQVDGGTISSFASTGIDDNAVTIAMTIDSSGNIGVGTTSPAVPLQVIGGSNQLRVGPDASNYLNFHVNGSGIPTISASGNWMNFQIGSNLLLMSETELRPNSSDDDLFSLGTTSARWNSLHVGTADSSFAGNVGIGTTSPSEKLEVSGNVKATGFVSTSDRKFKKDIQPIDDALSKILSLRGVTYNWRQQDFPERQFNEELQYGVIAQEVAEVFPDLVYGKDGKDGNMSVAYTGLIAPLIEAIKTQHELIEQQQSQQRQFKRYYQSHLRRIEKDNSQLRKEIEELKKIILSKQ